VKRPNNLEIVASERNYFDYQLLVVLALGYGMLSIIGFFFTKGLLYSPKYQRFENEDFVRTDLEWSFTK